jgi:hypothetical protein
MRVKLYEIKAAGRDTEYVRGTAKVAQRRVRELHLLGWGAVLRCIKNKAEQREVLAVQ